MKYWAVFKTSWSNGFVYRLNFLLWRARSVIIVLTVYFLWDTIFQNNPAAFGYTHEKILTYVFMTLLLRSLILGGRSIDVGGEISDGRLSNYLLRPVNYFYYWFTRDWADKLLNMIFSIAEITVLYFWLRPQIMFPTDSATILLFLAAVSIGIGLNFVIGFITSTATFWAPGNTWGFWFIYLVILEVLSGIMFPLYVLPKIAYDLLMLTPFPYLLYFPTAVYLGKLELTLILRGLLVSGVWLVALYWLSRKFWNKGVMVYQSEGR